MKKTISEWLEELPEPHRSKAIANYANKSIRQRGVSADRKFSNIGDAIYNAFHLSATPEGGLYWIKVADDIRKERISDALYWMNEVLYPNMDDEYLYDFASQLVRVGAILDTANDLNPEEFSKGKIDVVKGFLDKVKLYLLGVEREVEVAKKSVERESVVGDADFEKEKGHVIYMLRCLDHDSERYGLSQEVVDSAKIFINGLWEHRITADKLSHVDNDEQLLFQILLKGVKVSYSIFRDGKYVLVIKRGDLDNKYEGYDMSPQDAIKKIVDVTRSCESVEKKPATRESGVGLADANAISYGFGGE